MRFPWQKAKPLLESDIVEEFIECYLKMVPDERFVGFNEGFLKWQKADDSTHELSLGKIFHDVALLAKNNRRTRDEIYQAFITAMHGSGPMPDKLSPEYHSRVLPAIRTRGYLDQVRKSLNTEVPYRDLNGELHSEYIIAYSVDFPTTVAHVAERQAEELELDEAGLYEISMQNLREFLPRAAFRQIFDEMAEPQMLPCEDGHARARMLVIGEYLEAGEEVAVVIPDGAMLFLLPIPPNNNWNPLRKLAEESNATGFSRPFLITKDQIRGM